MKTETANFCPACDAGQLREQRIDYTVTASEGVKVVVPNLLVEVCDHCGEILLSADAAAAVDIAIAEQTEQLTPRSPLVNQEPLMVRPSIRPIARPPLFL